jgi:hypothetical protein
VAWLFIAAMIAFFTSLLSFRMEILLATKHMRIGPH